MDTGKLGKSSSHKGVSSIVGGLIVFGMIFSIAYGYFYTIGQDQRVYQTAQQQSYVNTSLAGEESVFVTGMISGGKVAFMLNNSGIPVIITSYLVTDQSGKVDAYSSGTISQASSCKTTATVPCSLNQGIGTILITGIGYAAGNYYTMKIVTSRGSTFTGTYPTNQITSTSINSIVASGIGSVVMIFSSFVFYPYSQTGGPWVVNLSSPMNAAITPYSKHMVLGVQVTNDDPQAGTIVLDSHTDLWTFVSCSGGCGTQSILFFYIMNVAPSGTVTSTSQGSFVPISIPYGATVTLYFGSQNDLSLGSYNYQSITDAVGEHDVFLILSGTKVLTSNSTLYSQNLPFAATFTADNIASYSQNVYSCSPGTQQNFQLSITNSKYSAYTINQLTVDTSGLSVVTPISSPSGWTGSYNSNTETITWSTTGSGIGIGSTVTFSWTANIPSGSAGTQYTFPSTAYFSGGSITSQQVTTGCYIV